MTPDEMKALIAEARERAYAPTPTEGLIRRLADALEAALSSHPDEEAERLLLALRALGADIPARLDDARLLEAAAVPREAVVVLAKIFARGRITDEDLHQMVRCGLAQPPRPDEEAEWEYRRVDPRGVAHPATFESLPALDEGWTAERRALGPWSPVPTDGEGQTDG